MATTPYVAATVPAKKVRYSGTTLFHVAMMQDNDPLQWAAIAQLNGMIDPWLTGEVEVKIPPVFPTGAQAGLLLVVPGGATASPTEPSSDYKLSFIDLQDFRNLIGL